MSWHLTSLEQFAYSLRTAVRSVLLSTGLVVSLLLLYVVARGAWHFVLYVERTIFASPW